MILRTITWLFSLQFVYTNPVERQRARALLTMTWAGLLIWLGIYLFVILPLVDRGEIPGNGFLFLSMTVTPAVLVVIFFAVQQGRLQLASSIFVAGLLALTVPLGLVSHIDLMQIAPIIALAAAGVLLDRRGLAVATLICVGSMIATGSYQSGLMQVERFVPAELATNETITMIGIVLLIAAFLYAFSGTPERVARDASRVANQWRSTSILTDRVFVDEDVAIETALRLARDELDYDVVQVYLLNERVGTLRRYRLIEGSAMMALDASPTLAIQTVLRDFDPLVIRAGDARAADHLINPARFSVSVPILFEGTSLGVLDVQTNTLTIPDEQRIAVLRGLAAQLGRTLAQSRRISALEYDVREQEGAAQRLRSQLAELQRRAEGTTTAGWERYLRGLGVTGYGYDFQGGAMRSLVTASDLPPAVRATLERGDVFIDRSNNRQTISAPITYRNQMLGAMTFEVSPERTLGDSELELMRTVSSRLGIALENNRLFEQSQAQAQRERKASDVGGLLLTATDIEQVLALAAETFNEALGATHTRVSLQPGSMQALDAEGG